MKQQLAMIAGLLLVLILGFALLTGDAGAQQPAPSRPGVAASHILPVPIATGTPLPVCGLAWRIVPSPSTGGDSHSLSSVAVVSADDIWAVGGYWAGSGYRTEILHYTGGQWQIVPSPNLTMTHSYLDGVVALSANDVWAVGSTSMSQGRQTLTMHYTGGQWQVVPSPSIGVDSRLWKVSAGPAGEIWAVGTSYETLSTSDAKTLTMRYTNGQWQVVPSPNVGFGWDNYLVGVSVAPGGDVWAVGYYWQGSAGFGALAMRYTGGQWQLVTPPVVGAEGDFLNGVTAISSDDVWAVGTTNIGDEYKTLTLHYTNGQWHVVPSPNGGGVTNELVSVAAASPGDLWAVGYTRTANVTRTLILHYINGQWQVVPSPDDVDLHAVAVVSTDDVWAVGSRQGGTLTMHYSEVAPCNTPTPVPPTATATTPSPTPCGGGNYGVITSTGTIVPGTTDIGNHCNDCTTNVTLPFPFQLYDQVFTTALVSSNGLIEFTNSQPDSFNSCLPVTFPEFTYTIMAYWDDQTTNYPGTNTGIYTSTTGTAPNRVFNIEFRTCQFDIFRDCFNTDANYEVRLYEGSSRFDIIYGELDLRADSTTIGVQRDATKYTQYSCNTQINGLTGRMLTFDLPSCSSASPQPTLTPIATLTVSSTAATPTGMTATATPTVAATATGTNTATTIPTATSTLIMPTPTALIPPATVTSPTGTAVQPTSSIAQPTVTTCPLAFADMPPTGSFYSYVRCLACRGIASGYACGGDGEPCDDLNTPYFRPNANVTRGQIAKIVSNSAGYAEDPNPQIYEDVDPSNAFYQWINRLSRRGHMGGYPCGAVSGEPCNPPDNRPYFRPSNNATRGQLVKIVSNAAGLGDTGAAQIFADVAPGNDFYTWVQRLASRSMVGGYPCGGGGEPCDGQVRPYFRPYNDVTRGQASKIIANSFFPNCQVPSR
ncbi:MAG TPA: S-layer homology domain-containing protein [Chloroflexia bacterium]